MSLLHLSHWRRILSLVVRVVLHNYLLVSYGKHFVRLSKTFLIGTGPAQTETVVEKDKDDGRSFPHKSATQKVIICLSESVNNCFTLPYCCVTFAFASNRVGLQFAIVICRSGLCPTRKFSAQMTFLRNRHTRPTRTKFAS